MRRGGISDRLHWRCSGRNISAHRLHPSELRGKRKPKRRAILKPAVARKVSAENLRAPSIQGYGRAHQGPAWCLLQKLFPRERRSSWRTFSAAPEGFGLPVASCKGLQRPTERGELFYLFPFCVRLRLQKPNVLLAESEVAERFFGRSILRFVAKVCQRPAFSAAPNSTVRDPARGTEGCRSLPWKKGLPKIIFRVAGKAVVAVERSVRMDFSQCLSRQPDSKMPFATIGAGGNTWTRIRTM